MIGLYVHVPFCTTRCSYCDFYLVPARGRDLDALARALRAEIAAVAPPLRGRAADTIHLGGGTPSIVPPAIVEIILAALRGTFSVAPGAEVALEANPEDLDRERCRDLVGLGVNRIVVGVQTLDDELLKRLRRTHTARRALQAVVAARASGARSVGADLILGIPGQGRGETLGAIERLVDGGVDHLSLYLLEIHARTRLGRAAALGHIALPDEDEVAALYEAAADRLAALGFEHYEISNFARPGYRSRHNLKYWTDQEYLGFGPSAHSYAEGRRWFNAPDLAAYLARGGAGCARIEEAPSRVGRGAEALLAGLRITEGVDLLALRGRYGGSVPAPDDGAIALLEGAGLVDRLGSRLRLTRRGRLVSNEVLERLLPGTSGLTAGVN